VNKVAGEGMQKSKVRPAHRMGLLALRSEQMIFWLEKKLFHDPDGLYEIGH
jgi:hypothetical protein